MNGDDPSEPGDGLPQPGLEAVSQCPLGAGALDAPALEPDQEVRPVDAHHLDIATVGLYRRPDAVDDRFDPETIDDHCLHTRTRHLGLEAPLYLRSSVSWEVHST
jgi:hypothetical protein